MTEVKIPSTLNKLNHSVFGGCSLLNNIALPDAVEVIPNSAFCCCTSLTNLTMGNVKEIGSTAFHNTGLKSFVASNQLNRLGEFAFASSKIETVDLSRAKFYVLANNAFAECTKLTSVTLPEMCTNIGSQTFAKTGLTQITIPKNITIINAGAFQESTALSTIKYESTVAEWNNVTKDHTFMQDIASWKIECTDGTIDQNGNVIYN